jgi:hypothetical protein
MNKDKVYFHDLKSKFGSLVLMQNDVEMSENKLSIQIGRTLVEVKMCPGNNLKPQQEEKMGNVNLINLKLAKTSNFTEKNLFENENENDEFEKNGEVNLMNEKFSNLVELNLNLNENKNIVKKNRNPSK